MGKDWFPIRAKTEQAKMKHVQGRIEGFPEEAVGKYLFQKLQSIAAASADVMRTYISLDKNTKKYERTGVRGRKVTGDMIAGVKWSGKKVGPNKYSFKFGWINGTPGYSIFQEHGTKNGVRAMNSIQYATNFARQELRLLAQNPSSYKVSGASAWPSGD